MPASTKLPISISCSSVVLQPCVTGGRSSTALSCVRAIEDDGSFAADVRAVLARTLMSISRN